MRRLLPFALDIIALLAAWAAAAAPLPRRFIENIYANGIFAHLNAAAVPLTNRVPFAVGDIEAAIAIVVLLACWIVRLRRAPRGRKLRAAGALLAHTAGWVGVLIVAFFLLWGWNYRRAPVTARVQFDETRVTDAAVDAYSAMIVDTLNTNYVAAHAETLDLGKLASAWSPLVQRLGDRWNVAVTVPKTTVLQPYYDAAGIGGQYSPLAFETLLNKSFLSIEAPRAIAHEWAHVAGFTDEGDANYIGTLACLRSNDPLIKYSGAFWTYGELPERDRNRLHLDPRVIADFRESDARFRKHYVPQLFAISWNLYDRYLHANNVSGGVASYGYFLQRLVGTRVDSDGLPLLRARVRKQAS